MPNQVPGLRMQPAGRGPRLGSTRFGDSPMVLATVLMGSGFLMSSLSMSQLAAGGNLFGDGSNGGLPVTATSTATTTVTATPTAMVTVTVEATATPSPTAKTSSGQVTLPDVNNNGIPDQYEGVDGRKSSSDPTTPGGVRPVKPHGRYIYIVKPNETLASISAVTGVSVDRLVAANNIADPNLIYHGSALVIPATR